MTDDYDYLTCTHCHGKGFHGTGAAWDEDTGRSYPTDCGCCSGRGEHRVWADDAPARYPCFS